jgi:hypothetical protein
MALQKAWCAATKHSDALANRQDTAVVQAVVGNETEDGTVEKRDPPVPDPERGVDA